MVMGKAQKLLVLKQRKRETTYNRGNKRKGCQNQESSKKQTIAVHAATTQTTPTPATPTPTTPTLTRPYASTQPKCDKCGFHHHGTCQDLQCTLCNRKGYTAWYYRFRLSKTTNPTIPGQVKHVTGVGRPATIKGTAPRQTTEIKEEQTESEPWDKGKMCMIRQW